MPKKIAIVGVGKIARDQHIPSIRASEDFELAATASRNSVVEGATPYPDLEALLDAEPDIDCVSLCTPPQVRYADARLALEAGRHVMLEKPPGATVSEVHDLAKLAKQANRTLFATWHSREAAAVDTARQWLATHALTSMHIEWKEDVRHWHPGQDWVWEAGSLGVFDPGINALSVMTAILPEALHLASADLYFPENRAAPATADLTFRNLGDAPVTAVFDWLQPGPPTWNIHMETEMGKAILSEGGAAFRAENGPTVQGPNQEYARLYKSFSELVEASKSDVDLSPMLHVSDAFTIGNRTTIDPFEW